MQRRQIKIGNNIRVQCVRAVLGMKQIAKRNIAHFRIGDAKHGKFLAYIFSEAFVAVEFLSIIKILSKNLTSKKKRATKKNVFHLGCKVNRNPASSDNCSTSVVSLNYYICRMKHSGILISLFVFIAFFAVAQKPREFSTDHLKQLQEVSAEEKFRLLKEWKTAQPELYSSAVNELLWDIRKEAMASGNKKLQQQSNIALSDFVAPDTALMLLEEALRLEVISREDSLTCFAALNKCFRHFKMLPKAVDTYRIVEKLAKNDNAFFANTVLGMARMYLETGYYQEAINFFRLAHSLNPEKDQLTPRANHHNDIGFIYYKMGINDSALYYLNSAAAMVDSLLSKNTNSYRLFFRGLVRGNIGSVYMKQGQIVRAIPLLTEDVNASMDYPNYPNAFNSLIELAECYEISGDTKQAQACLEKAEALLKHNPPQHTVLRFYKTFADFHEKQGNKIKAFDYLKNYRQLSDSLSAVERQQLLHASSIVYESERKDAEAFRKKTGFHIENIHKNWLCIAIIIFSTLVLVIVYLLFYIGRLKSKK